MIVKKKKKKCNSGIFVDEADGTLATLAVHNFESHVSFCFICVQKVASFSSQIKPQLLLH